MVDWRKRHSEPDGSEKMSKGMTRLNSETEVTVEPRSKGVAREWFEIWREVYEAAKRISRGRRRREGTAHRLDAA